MGSVHVQSRVAHIVAISLVGLTGKYIGQSPGFFLARRPKRLNLRLRVPFTQIDDDEIPLLVLEPGMVETKKLASGVTPCIAIAPLGIDE